MGREDMPGFTLQFRSIKKMLRFGLYEAGNNLVSILSSVVDKAIIGRYLGAYELGLYAIAWELAMVPVSRINPLITRVAYPVLSTVQDQPEKRNLVFQKITHTLMSINIPVLLFLGLFPAPILTIFFGPAWARGAICLSLLSLLGLGRAFTNLGAGIFLAQGHSDVNFSWNIVVSATTALLLITVFPFYCSLESAALVQAVPYWGLLGAWLWLLRKKGGISISPFLRILIRCILFTLPVGFFLLLLDFWNIPDIHKLVIGMVGSAILYMVTLWIFDRPFVLAIKSWFLLSIK